MEYYAVQFVVGEKKKKKTQFVLALMELVDIILSKVRHKDTNRSRMIFLICVDLQIYTKVATKGQRQHNRRTDPYNLVGRVEGLKGKGIKVRDRGREVYSGDGYSAEIWA